MTPSPVTSVTIPGVGRRIKRAAFTKDRVVIREMQFGIILVTGDRQWRHRGLIRRELMRHMPSKILHGGARGADTIAGQVASALGIAVVEFRAQWNVFGRKAGPMRNRAMLAAKPDMVLAFHDDPARSRGTKDCVVEARRQGIPVMLVKTTGFCSWWSGQRWATIST